MAKTAEDSYFDDCKPKHLFNLFYSTVNTLHARLYSKAPNPDVRRRFEMQGAEGHAAKQAAILVERGISHQIDSTAFHGSCDRAVFDYLVAGAGIPWAEYHADIVQGELGTPEIAFQRVEVKHVPWKRFHWEPGKDWEDCDWIARDHFLSKRELREQFDQEPDGDSKAQRDGDKLGQDKYQQTYRVTEIWDKPTRKVIVVGWDFDEPLEVRDDKLGLSGFFPCPRPMFANIRSQELVPKPDYAFFEESYKYINRLTKRIHALTTQIKAVGFYDAQLTELAQLATAEDGTLVPVSQLAERLALTSANDFSKTIAQLPIQEKVTVVRELQTLLAGEKQRLDESNGIADIVRGSTNPNETAKAQTIKDNWANLRLARKTGDVSSCIRDLFRIMTEIMCEHFTPQTWYLTTGMQPDPQVMQIMKSDVSRSLAIDVETDSTIALEDEEEKRQRIEFLNYVSPFLQQMLPAIQQGILPADIGKELLLFAIRSFKHGRQLEDAIEAAPGTMEQLTQLQQAVQQAQQQAQQTGQQLQQAQQQIAQFDQQKQQVDGQKAQGQIMKVQADAQNTQQQAANDSTRNQIEAFKAQTDRAALMNPQVHTTSII